MTQIEAGQASRRHFWNRGRTGHALSRSTRALLALAVAALLASVAALSPASALAWRGQADNVRWQVLRFPPQPGDASCVSRTIYLAAGNYRWDLRNGFPYSGYAGFSREVYFSTGNHNWLDCINEENGNRWYRHVSYIDGYVLRGVLDPVAHGYLGNKHYQTYYGSRLRRY